MITSTDLLTDIVQRQCASSQQGPTPEWTQKEVSGRLIVRFKSYKPAAAHRAEIAASVAGEGSSWTWINRTNAAAAYPTDFALLDVLDSEADKVKVRFAFTTQSTKANLFAVMQTCHCILHNQNVIMPSIKSLVLAEQHIEIAHLQTNGKHPRLAGHTTILAVTHLCHSSLSMQEQLQLLSNVKDTHAEQQVRLSLTLDTAQNQQQTDTEWAQKRPGRCVSVTICRLHLLQVV